MMLIYSAILLVYLVCQIRQTDLFYLPMLTRDDAMLMPSMTAVLPATTAGAMRC
jgi:hypothetical protein